MAVLQRSDHPCRCAIQPTDPAGAKPRRDRRLLDRWSRHEVPMTPGKKTSGKIYDPGRVSHSTGKLDKCDTLPGSWGFFPTELSRGLRRGVRPSSTPGRNTEHPCRGASPSDSADSSDKDGTRPMSGAPRRGAFFIAVSLSHDRGGAFEPRSKAPPRHSNKGDKSFGSRCS